MAGYNYTKRSVLLSSWLVTVTLKEVFTLFMTGYNYTKRSVHSLMAGYNYTKRSVHSLHDWLQLY